MGARWALVGYPTAALSLQYLLAVLGVILTSLFVKDFTIGLLIATVVFKNYGTICAIILTIAFLTGSLEAVTMICTTRKGRQWLVLFACAAGLCRPRNSTRPHDRGLSQGRAFHESRNACLHRSDALSLFEVSVRIGDRLFHHLDYRHGKPRSQVKSPGFSWKNILA